jgi:hypothetical protein
MCFDSTKGANLAEQLDSRCAAQEAVDAEPHLLATKHPRWRRQGFLYKAALSRCPRQQWLLIAFWIAGNEREEGSKHRSSPTNAEVGTITSRDIYHEIV